MANTGLHKGFQHNGRAVPLEFGHIFTSKGARSGKTQAQPVIQSLA